MSEVMDRCRVSVLKDGQTHQREIGADPAGKQTLLLALEHEKLAMPYGCRAGACGSCLVLVTGGAAMLESADPIERDTLERCNRGPGSRLGCRAKLAPGANGELRLEVPTHDDSGAVV